MHVSPEFLGEHQSESNTMVLTVECLLSDPRRWDAATADFPVIPRGCTLVRRASVTTRLVASSGRTDKKNDLKIPSRTLSMKSSRPEYLVNWQKLLCATAATMSGGFAYVGNLRTIHHRPSDARGRISGARSARFPLPRCDLDLCTRRFDVATFLSSTATLGSSAEILALATVNNKCHVLIRIVVRLPCEARSHRRDNLTTGTPRCSCHRLP